MGKLSHIVKAIEGAKKRKLEAYHGSQENFDKFSIDKIGTGMGGDESYDGAGLFFNEKKGFVEKNFAEDGVVYKTELDIDPEIEMLDQKKSLKKHTNHKQILKMLNDVDADIDWSNLKGNEVVSELYYVTNDWDEVRKRLSSVGIKGAKYKQERTSLGGAGTQNYVIFDDSLISIAEKNGIPFEQVEDLAKSKGITKQQALTMIMGGSAIGLGAQSQDAQANIYPSQQTMAQELNAPKPLNRFVEKRKQRANSLVNRIGYAAEPIATMATGYGKDVLSGLAGVASLPFGVEQAAKNIESVQNFIPTYMPQTEGGNKAFEDLGGLIDKGEQMYNFTADKTGFDPMANFEETQEWLHKKGMNKTASVLKGLPEIL